jgi:tRNA pseudouridine38-40 synthase
MIQDWIYYKAVVGYNGASFEGWQSQVHKNTIQDSIERALYQTFCVFQKIVGASRTDSGVHARGQVFSFYAPKDISQERLICILNKKLPSSIIIFSIENVPLKFHPRFDAKKKVYEYRFSTRKLCPLLFQNVFNLSYRVNINALLSILQVFVGTHDFFLFSSLEKEKNSVRTIHSISAREEHESEVICLEFEGNGFLRYMIRNIVGTAIHFTQNNLNRNILIKLLQDGKIIEKNKKESHCFIKKIMPNGLTLLKVYYENE